MKTDKLYRRVAFEKWCMEFYGLSEPPPQLMSGWYRDHHHQWCAWQAAIEEIANEVTSHNYKKAFFKLLPILRAKAGDVVPEDSDELIAWLEE